MKARLMHPDRGFDAKRALPPLADDVWQDLALDTLLAAMAGDDGFIGEIAGKALLGACDSNVEGVRYRQAVVRDAIDHPDPVRNMYALAAAALEDRRKSYWGFMGRHPSSILFSAIQVLGMFLDRLRELRGIVEANARQFESKGFCDLFAMLQKEFDDAWLAQAEALLAELKFPDGTLVSAAFGPGCESTDYTLRRTPESDRHWWKRLLEHTPSNWTVRIAQRDLIGAKTLGEMRDRAIIDIADTLAQTVDHIQRFFEMLHTELAFHVGCVNLHERLQARDVLICFPEPLVPRESAGFQARGLRDASLLLATDGEVVGNDLDAANTRLLVITGANQGGKSTFLRGLGLAQLMLQAGLFVTAEAFASTLCSGVFTHYKREEDAEMEQGKLDEELARISQIADAIRPGALLLANESFASTNEREGSELARQVVGALLERGIRVAFVTHLYSFARSTYQRHRDHALILRAERLPDGSRSFHLIEAAPQETSYGEDLYREVFGDDPAETHASDEVASEPEPRTAQAGR